MSYQTSLLRILFLFNPRLSQKQLHEFVISDHPKQIMLKRPLQKLPLRNLSRTIRANNARLDLCVEDMLKGKLVYLNKSLFGPGNPITVSLATFSFRKSENLPQRKVPHCSCLRKIILPAWKITCRDVWDSLVGRLNDRFPNVSDLIQNQHSLELQDYNR